MRNLCSTLLNYSSAERKREIQLSISKVALTYCQRLKHTQEVTLQFIKINNNNFLYTHIDITT